MSLQFRARVNRYRNGENRLGHPVWIKAVDFVDAAGRANDMVAAMAAADPDSRFSVAELHVDGLRYTDCINGMRMFETEAEMLDRRSPEQKS